MRTLLPILPLSLCLSACQTQKPAGFDAALPPALAAPLATRADGAIFQAASGYAPLHYGTRAAQVGDIITVALVERTQTSKSTAGRTDRSGDASITPPAAGPIVIDPAALKISSGGSFKGQGNASQASSLQGDITVTIAQVRPNGTALIRGEKVMTFSQGDEWIQLTGIIRLSDIDADNRIASTRIADAKIAYAGSGAIQKSSQPGWLSRFFTAVSPF